MNKNATDFALIETDEAITFSNTARMIEQQLQVAKMMIDRLKKDGNAVRKVAHKSAIQKVTNGQIEDADDDEELLNIQMIVGDMDNMKEQLQLVMKKLHAYSSLCRRY